LPQQVVWISGQSKRGACWDGGAVACCEERAQGVGVAAFSLLGDLQAASVRVTTSGIQIDPNGEEFRPEKAHRPRVPGTTRQLISQPALALTRIVVREQMCRARVPVIP
jgi:hypothetical protein